VNDDLGTGHHLTFEGGVREPIFTARPGIEVVGKTGTAEAPDILADTDPDSDRARRILREGDHSWFVVMVGHAGGRPRYVISVIMEYAGSGGRVSGPICNQIVGALVAEGYL
jgi:cell division protein FtsI/penicillin-binding protein 2